MNRRSLPAAASLLMIVAVASACSDDASGTPIPMATQTTTAPGTTATTSTSRLLPPRPTDVDVTGLDPCTALTVEQEKQLQYDLGWQRRPQPGIDPARGGPNCAYGSSRRLFGSLIAFVTTDGAEIWLSDHAGERPPVHTTISGFPALQITPAANKPLPDECNVVVDVHDGQYLDVFSSKSPGGGVTGSAAYCNEAKKVAAMVLANVRER